MDHFDETKQSRLPAYGLGARVKRGVGQLLKARPVLDPYIPERFRNAILLHLLQNAIGDSITPPELFLGIHGPPGVGKSWQLRRLLVELGVHVIDIAASELEHEEANKPARMIKERYHQALEYRQTYREPSAIIINDFDLGVGVQNSLTQYTVNLQHNISCLMDLADSPWKAIGLRDDDALRLPVYITGNNLMVLHGPLRRSGRMRFFEWISTSQELALIISPLFPDATPDILKSLVELEPPAPVAFFSALRRKLIEAQLLQLVERASVRTVIRDIVINGAGPTFDDLLNNFDGDHILQGATELLTQQTIRDHLAGSSGAQEAVRK